MAPIDMKLCPTSMEGTKPTKASLDRLEATRKLLNQNVSESLKKQQQRYKRAYDKKYNVHANDAFVVGDMVQYLNARKESRMGTILLSLSFDFDLMNMKVR